MMLSAICSPISRAMPVIEPIGAYRLHDCPVMLDFLLLRAPISANHLQFPLSPEGCTDYSRQPLPLSDDFLINLDLSLRFSLCRRSGLSNVDVPWDSIDSGFGTLAVKLFLGHPHKCGGYPYVEIKCSPAKLAQGHNVFGPADLSHGCRLLLDAFSQQLPTLSGFVDWSAWEVMRIDVNAPSWATSPDPAKPDRTALEFLLSMYNINAGHRKANSDDSHTQQDSSEMSLYKGSVYWSPKSDVLRLKLYLKGPEFRKYYKKMMATNPLLFSKVKAQLSQLIEETKGMLRWEAQFLKKWFVRRGQSTLLTDICKDFESGKFTLYDLWAAAFGPIFKTFEGHVMRQLPQVDIEQAIENAGTVTKIATSEKTYFSEFQRARIIRDSATAGKRLISEDCKIMDNGSPVAGVLQFEYTKKVGSGSEAVETYRRILRDGFTIAKREIESRSRMTWHRHLTIIKSAGISVASLQQEKGNGTRPTVVPFVRYVPAAFTHYKTA